MISPTQNHLSPNRRAWRRFRNNRIAFFSGLLLAGIILIVLSWPLIIKLPRYTPLSQALGHSPSKTSDAQFQSPSAVYWLGTDVHGRDLLSRILYGARISLLVGLVGAGVSLVIGVVWGAIAGYAGGRLDGAMMRFVDILYSLPSIIFVIVLITTVEDLFKNWLADTFSAASGPVARMLFLFLGLGAVSWLTMARIVRGQVLSLRTRNFIDASRVLGASHGRILFRHILPNISGVILVYLTLTIPSVILYESFLSYLGLGIQPPQASLGSLLAEGASQINPLRIYWWLVVFPASFLLITLLAMNFLGDGLRDAFDPQASD
jgi:oligopeptide transport system permease protein